MSVGDGDEAVGSIANPITFSDAEIRYERRPPGLGAHSDEIRAWLEGPEARSDPETPDGPQNEEHA